jgi:hypothetical protein
MAQKKKSPASKAVPAPVPEKPSPPHVEAAQARVQEYVATCPPSLAFKASTDGGIELDISAMKDGLPYLMEAVGTRDAHFFSGFLTDIINANTSSKDKDPYKTNTALAFIRSIKPRDETEACLAAQMAATHSAVMTFARRLNHVDNIQQQDSAINAYNKLARTYAAQMESLKRYRSTGEQKVTVTHVSVSDGGQAIVGNVTTGGGGAKKEETTS